uniref:NADH-ubiquinone oxidoreductase chain 2 n=1 Tax=Paederus fuscipes TaxID=347427 RepID=A0A344H236_9COLE|nr:NADH dehydrogenase subunit 2 [Paederus fuscipes]
MFNLYKILFFISLMLGTLMTISSYTWMGMWMGLEINLLSIIPLMNNIKNLSASEASLKYFITQALASTLILFSILLMSNYWINLNSSMIFIFNSGLLTKMGAAPFHFWFPEIMEGLSWNNCLIMMTIQKIAPLILLMMNLNYPIFFFIIIVISMMISGFMGINQTSLRKILTYSSINHLAWMISSMMFFKTIWLIYMITYMITSINIILIFKKMNIFFMKQLIFLNNKNFALKIIISLNLMSLGGLPPFIGFFPKWCTIQNLISMNSTFLSFLMTLLTLLTLFFYIRMIYSTLTISQTKIKWMMNSNSTFNWVIFNNIVTLSLLIISTMIWII